jgi:hypothetical protein
MAGEQFLEEFAIERDLVEADWSVVDREFPTSKQTSNAIFVVEGTAKFSSNRKDQTWREAFKLRSGLHDFAKTPQVHVDMEIILDGGSKGGINADDDASKRWRKALRRRMKDSLALLKLRVESLPPRENTKTNVDDAKRDQERSGKESSSSSSSSSSSAKKKNRQSQKQEKKK